ncbi:MAG: tRNA lysidine(34) synthetase TilS [Candidatus Eremiobacteraeota bacterium]|nr:tRNA lysidine(34) synthetase TilS [Candidatus Eremiobacteraeota bacterium]
MKRNAKRRATRAAAPNRTVVVAASGGADSAAALLLAREAMPDVRLYAAYIDHGLRPRRAIAADIASVRAQARHAGARVIVARVKPAARGVSVEAAARAARYRELARIAARVGAGTIVTGHHRDDLSETVLLALARGSGLDGVAALRRRRALAPGVTLLRPLLRYGKDELREFVRASGVPYATDETNDDTRLRRNAVRALLRELEERMPGTSAAIARSAALLAADRRLLDRMTRTAWQRARHGTTGEELSARALRALDPPLLRRVIRYSVRRSVGDLQDFHFAHCEAIARAIAQGRGGRFHAGRASVELSVGRLIVHPDTPSDGRPPGAGSVASPAGSTIVVPRGGKIERDDTGTIELRRTTRGRAPRGAMLLDPDALPENAALSIRAPRTGDTCVPSGRRRPTSLARFLAKAGIPRHRRGETPVLCLADRIVAVLGVRVMEPFAARGDRVLALLWAGSQNG